MDLEKLLRREKPPSAEDYRLAYPDFVRLFWKYKGLLKERERNNAFWAATNENLRMAYEELDEQEQRLEEAYEIIQEDLKVANQIQSALLPETPPGMRRELEVAVHHRQLSAVGGDYYDFFETADGRYAVGVFDICGHGVSAALAMAFLRSELIQATAAVSSPKGVADEVNDRVIDFLRRVKKYATVNYVLFEPAAIRYVCGGGNGLLIHSGKAITFSRQDSFLGLRRRPYRESELPFVEGDLLALYTDGIVEAQNRRGEDYTIRRLNRLIQTNAQRPVNEILEICVSDYQEFCAEPQDDETLLIMRKTNEP